MISTLQLELLGEGLPSGTGSITDWALGQFQSRYGPEIDKGDVWEYLYGVMHAADWREFFCHDLEPNLLRVPLADDFEAFRSAGRKLMDLHIGSATLDEWPAVCLVDDQPDEGDSDARAYRIEGSLRWGRHADGRDDRSVLVINDRCRLVGIPLEASHHEVSGRTPLKWAVESLRINSDGDSDMAGDPNEWRGCADDPFNLIRHLRRLIRVSYESSLIIAWLPSAVDPPDRYMPGPVTLDDLLDSAKNAQPLEDSTGIIYTDEEFDEHLRSQPVALDSEL